MKTLLLKVICMVLTPRAATIAGAAEIKPGELTLDASAAR
jgi:hypothetical protein